MARKVVRACPHNDEAVVVGLDFLNDPRATEIWELEEPEEGLPSARALVWE
jgi:hypothetical protein